MDDIRLTYALVISFFLHCCILAGLSVSQMRLSKKSFKKIEVAYMRPMRQSAQNNKYTQDIPTKTIKEKKIKTKEIVKRFEMLPSSESSLFSSQDKVKDISKLNGASKLADKQPLTFKEAASLKSEKKISVPILKSEKITNIKYVSYNENIRQKIRQQAYKYAENPDFQSGEVYLTFVLGANGLLKDIKIIEEKTRANTFLRNVGLRSVREASPFASFPKDLSYPELTFNVVISFEVK